MRMLPAIGVFTLAVLSFAATPAAAQQGAAYMWCVAWTDTDADKAYFYSAFFSAGAWEAERKALAFKNEVARVEASTATLKSTCMAPAAYDAVVAARNAAMKAAPGKVLNWEG